MSLEVLWFDDDVLELRVRAGNGSFAGVADCYESHDVLPRLVTALRGFPRGRDDVREFEVGTIEPGFAGGGVELRLRCVDAALHAVVEVRLRGAPAGHAERDETASFACPVEPAALDDFVAAIRSMETIVGARAWLRSAAGMPWCQASQMASGPRAELLEDWNLARERRPLRRIDPLE